MRKSKTPIIVFYGPKGVGKDTCCEIAEDYLDAYWRKQNAGGFRVSFAKALRETCWDLFKRKIGKKEYLYGDIKQKEKAIKGWRIPEDIRKRCGFKETFWTGRRLLQWFGTDTCRHVYSDIWVDKLDDEIEEVNKDRSVKAIFVSDCRFLNEYKMLNNRNAIFIKVDRPSRKKNKFSGHKSELDIDKFVYQHYIKNSGTINQLGCTVLDLMDRLVIK